MQFTRSFVPIILLTLGGALVLGDCAPERGDVESRANPLLAEWDTPFGVPPFDQIRNDDYLPAFHAAMENHAAEIEAIVSNRLSRIRSWRWNAPVRTCPACHACSTPWRAQTPTTHYAR